MQRRAVLAAIWATGTVVAMVLAVVAVGLAGSRITSRTVPVVSRDAVAEELATAGPTTTVPSVPAGLDLAGPVAGTDGATEGGAATAGVGRASGLAPTERGDADPAASAGPPAGAAPSTTAPPLVALPPPASLEPGDDGTTSNRSPGGSGGGGSSPGGSGSSPGGPAPTVATTTTAPPTSTRTITSPSGSIDVRCTGSTVTLLATAPAPGFAAKVITASGQEVKVQLLDAQGKGSELRARCANGVIDAQVQAK